MQSRTRIAKLVTGKGTVGVRQISLHTYSAKWTTGAIDITCPTIIHASGWHMCPTYMPRVHIGAYKSSRRGKAGLLATDCILTMAASIRDTTW